MSRGRTSARGLLGRTLESRNMDGLSILLLLRACLVALANAIIRLLSWPWWALRRLWQRRVRRIISTPMLLLQLVCTLPLVDYHMLTISSRIPNDRNDYATRYSRKPQARL